MNLKVLAGVAAVGVSVYAVGPKQTTKVALSGITLFAAWYGYKSGLIAALTKDIPVPSRITNVWNSVQARFRAQ